MSVCREPRLLELHPDKATAPSSGIWGILGRQPQERKRVPPDSRIRTHRFFHPRGPHLEQPYDFRLSPYKHL